MTRNDKRESDCFAIEFLGKSIDFLVGRSRSAKKKSKRRKEKEILEIREQSKEQGLTLLTVFSQEGKNS